MTERSQRERPERRGTDGGRGPGAAARIRRQRGWLIAAVASGLAAAALAPLAALVSGGSIAAMDLMSDPVEVTGIPWFVGGVASLNLFVWAAAAAVILLAAVGLRHVDARLSAALAGWGLLTAVLTLDDRFLLHEVVLPYLGVPEVLVYLLYVVVVLALLAGFRSELAGQPEVVLLLLGLGALAASVGLDVTGWDSTVRRVAEETAKMIGATALLCFPSAIVVRHLRRLPLPPGRS
ncbi:hypothetical protein E9549_04365 [Blastococcus sp. MG754426]|uniref:hypothetical protein n=1 Tax=unclassified Blastococcus TaxID=2619396 RepID=UPI001EF03E39|nr:MULTISPECIES: hypothetical protein [unclassified Blastococcus]MCF6506642.1 hypothetical protein [Blastococcus sp. MG754426]MCF6510354.1 hypothetical protein [Blastococcus sp. MG754427]